MLIVKCIFQHNKTPHHQSLQFNDHLHNINILSRLRCDDPLPPGFLLNVQSLPSSLLTRCPLQPLLLTCALVWCLWNTRHIYSPVILVLPPQGDLVVTHFSVRALKHPMSPEIFHLPRHSLISPGQSTPSAPLLQPSIDLLLQKII